MSLTESKMVALGVDAPAFSLHDVVSNKKISLDEYTDYKGYVIMFICNHCPFVIHVNSEIVKLSEEYSKKNIVFFAISSNDIKNYPADGPELMKEQALKLNYQFPYLYDETQEVAKAYDAACTPDFYVFNENKILIYRGRLDGSRPNSGIEVTGEDLRMALDNLLSGEAISTIQYPSIGCNIKWKNQ